MDGMQFSTWLVQVSVEYFGHHKVPMDGWKLDMSWS